jgi:RNA polymerase subunit RPABC4/transcription elongation factor Spt4
MRLIRLLCPHCRDAYTPTGNDLRVLGISKRDARDLVLYRPEGCERCRQTGYHGRTGVFELLEMTDNLRGLVVGNATEALVRRGAIEDGMVTLGQDALAKVLAGETSLDEVQRVVYYEEEMGHLCASCRKTVSPDHLYCPHCGTASSSACTACGKRVDPEWGFCPSCGIRRAQVPAIDPPRETEMIGEAPASSGTTPTTSLRPRPASRDVESPRQA